MLGLMMMGETGSSCIISKCLRLRTWLTDVDDSPSTLCENTCEAMQ